MSSRKAATVLLLWVMLVFVTAGAMFTSAFFAGVFSGSVLTACMLLLAVKWSIEGMMKGTMGNIEQMQETLAEHDPHRRE